MTRVFKYCIYAYVVVYLAILCSATAHSQQEEDNGLPVLAAHFAICEREDLDRMIERRYIRVLTTYNMTNYFISGGALHGFEYSLLKEYEKYINMNRKACDLPVVLEFLPVPRDRLIPMLNQGLGDIAAAGLAITSHRMAAVDFTAPYLSGINEIIVVRKGMSHIDTLNDMSGRNIVVRKRSSYYEGLARVNRKLRKKALLPIYIMKIDESLETEDILEMVNSGMIDITVADSHIAKFWSKIFNNIELKPNIKINSGSKIAWMVRKNNPKLKSSLNQFIRVHRKGTLKGNLYFKRYYENYRWIKNPLSDRRCTNLNYYIKLFKKYGRQYNIDWRLAMALAYQESGLQMHKKSHKGAIGVMQVKPETALDKNVNIENVANVENNIHAGIKYLSFLQRRYFSDKELMERDRIRFALASYNAGPYKIRRARKLARQMGLDPNRWFRNVELVALKTIGNEPVRFVSNINKYYIAYTLGLEDAD